MEVRAEGDGEGASKPQASLIAPLSDAKSMAGGEKTASSQGGRRRIAARVIDLIGRGTGS